MSEDLQVIEEKIRHYLETGESYMPDLRMLPESDYGARKDFL